MVVTALLGACVAIGVASLGEDAVGPALGMVALLVYGGALTGIGVAVAGLSRAAWAAPAVLAVAIGTSLIDLLAPALDLPDWVAQLALTEHLGDPMVGRWDLPGMALCLALAVGGFALGALGMSRRDVRGMTGGRRWTIGPRPGRRWLLLIYRIRAESSGRRTYVWRQLRQLGAVYLQQAVVVLPDRPELRVKVDAVGQRIRAGGGEASLLETVSPSAAWEAELIARFNAARDAEYEEIVDSVERFEDEIRREARKKRFRFAELEEGETDWKKLQGWFARLKERDFFGAPGRAGAEAALARGRRRARRVHPGGLPAGGAHADTSHALTGRAAGVVRTHISGTRRAHLARVACAHVRHVWSPAEGVADGAESPC